MDEALPGQECTELRGPTQVPRDGSRYRHLRRVRRRTLSNPNARATTGREWRTALHDLDVECRLEARPDLPAVLPARHRIPAHGYRVRPVAAPIHPAPTVIIVWRIHSRERCMVSSAVGA